MLALTLIFFVFQASAQDYDLKSNPRVRVQGDESVKPGVETHSGEEPPVDDEDAEAERSGRAPPAIRFGVLPSKVAAKPAKKLRKAPDPVRWGGSLSYGLRTDLADQIKPRLYTHTLALSYGFQHVPTGISLVGILAAAFESTGERDSEVLLDEDRAELFVNDFTLAMQIEWDPGFWKSSLTTTLANEFPTSPEARREDYGSVTSAELEWSVPLFRRRVSAGLRGELYYIWNSYEYSPATSELNKQGGARFEGSLRWKIWRGWFVSGVAGSQTSRYLDGTTDLTYRNSLATGYSWTSLSLSIASSNGTYLDREEANVWFVDEYHRVVSFAARLSF